MKGPEFFKGQLAKVYCAKKISDESIWIACPFHEEKNPSLGVNIKYGKFHDGKKIPLGFFRCFGCKKKGGWNVLAEKLGLQQINGHRSLDYTPSIDLKGVKASLFPEETAEGDSDTAGNLDDYTLFDLDKWHHKEWRGFKVELLKKLGAKLAYHDESQSFNIWFPVKVNKKRVGWFTALTKPIEGKSSYYNKKGVWIKKTGLFPFDTALKMMLRKGLKTMVLVEGQRDALRLLRAGIPAVAIMGTNNWTDDKIYILENAGIERIILCMDGDKAGKEATKKIKPTVLKYFEVETIKLWKLAEKMGVKKIDPYEAPVSLIRKLKEKLI